MISRFFIDRPIFAAVLSIVMTLAGAIALQTLPISLFPPVSPPTVQVNCTYPGASAQVVAETVATPIEQQVNGVENMMYMSSQCTNDGSYNLTVTFQHGVDLKVAMVMVQNRVSLAVPLLPDVLKQTGVDVRKQSPDILLSIALTSTNEIRLMPPPEAARGIPSEGENLIVVADVGGVLHFRVFDDDGRIKVDADEKTLSKHALQIAELRKQLENLWPPHGLTKEEKGGIITALRSIIGYTPKGHYNQLFLSNYALMHVREELARLPGISEVRVLGQRDYSMRVWVDPDKLASRNMMASDVVRAIRAQNSQVASGQIGQPPVPQGQPLQIPLSTKGRLTTVEEFEKIVVKVGPDGQVVRLKDIARIELGAKNQDINSQINGVPALNMAIFQLPDANALETADLVKAKIRELEKDFPEGVGYEIRYDTTPFIRESIKEVFKTLIEAVVLVAVVVILFLQNWRSALIPLVAVPVAIIGTFAVMAAFGFSLNNLTLFGLVLAIGIVVDDAIVVVEAVEHHIEHGLSPREATLRAMDEVSAPVIAIGLVLSAVFVPCAFISGIVGQFFRQFALTISASTIISTLNSLTLSPALAALLLRPRREGHTWALPLPAYAILGGWLGHVHLSPLLEGRSKGRIDLEGVSLALTYAGMVVGSIIGLLLAWPVDRLLSGFFRLFNSAFRRATRGYTWIVGGLLRGSPATLVIYGGLLLLTVQQFNTTPTGFIPSQDMGYLLVNVQLPDSTAAEITDVAMEKAARIAKTIKAVKHTFTVSGQSLLLSATGSNYGSMFVILDEYANRRSPEMASGKILARLKDLYQARMPEAVLTVLPPPPVRGVGRAGGFKLMVEDLGDNGPQVLQQQTELLSEFAAKDKSLGRLGAGGNSFPNLGSAFRANLLRYFAKDGSQTASGASGNSFANLASVFRANVPQLFADVNRADAMSKGVRLADLFDTLRIYLGSLYVNDFNLYGRTWQVIVQADPVFRNNPEGIRRLKLRNSVGTMIPLGSVMTLREVNNPSIVTRYNMHPAAPLQGAATQGVSSGQAIALMQSLADRKLYNSMAVEWTELAYLELQAGNTAMIVFGFAIAMVFLVLAAQYESWSLPLAIILVVPMCLLSSVIGVNIAGEDINVFTQIGFVVLVGLASKNAILIVEFAKHRREAGESRRDSTLEACSLRLRPIIMTSLAFILGVVPLLTGHGAGAEMRRTLGVTVFSGMVGVTLFGIFLTPVFFYVIDWLGGTRFFASPVVRRFAAMPLAILSLRAFLRPVRTDDRRPARPISSPQQAPSPSTVAVPDREDELVEQK